METKYRLITDLSKIQFSSDGNTAEVELFREGSWKHPSAPNGWFEIDQQRIGTFINNFNKGICGKELPLEFSHLPDSKSTPGWIVKMYEKDEGGVKSLWATMKLTDKAIAQRVKDGSLKYISPTVVSGYMDTATGQEFDVIRSATLTNYPHIKKLNPIAVNFEEVFEMDPIADILKKNDLQMEGLESLTLDNVKKEIDLEHLTKDHITKLAEHFEMTVDQFQEQFQGAGGQMEGNVPRIKMPEGVPPELKKQFKAAFEAAFAKTQDVDKATRFALKQIGVQMEENKDNKDGGIKDFTEKLITNLKKSIGIEDKPAVDKDKQTDSKFEEMTTKLEELQRFKLKTEFEEDSKLVANYPKLTPAAKNIMQTLLSAGRNLSVAFEDEKVQVHDLVVLLLEEIKKSPKTNLFTEKAEIANDEDKEPGVELSELANKIQKEDSKKSYRTCLEEASKQLEGKK